MNWADLGFRIEITGDGSPTLRLLAGVRDDFAEGEAMHHSGGAAEETDLIYGACIREVFKAHKNPRFLIVGLGLGYIEMFIAKEALLGNHLVGGVTSLESISDLRNLFKDWLSNSELTPEVQRTYDESLCFVLADSGVSAGAVKGFIKNNFNSSFEILEALQKNSIFSEKYHCILYDAFSGKTAPELWDEEFLIDFLTKTAAPEARLATYACRGSLKRALRAQNFEVLIGPGFHGKRKYTQGVRIPNRCPEEAV